MASNFLYLPPGAYAGWKGPVATASLLPATGNTVDDVRVATDTSVIYVWNGTAWVAEAGSGGVTSLNSLTGALTIAAGTGITVTPSGGNTLTIASTGGGTVTAVSVASANGFAGTSSGGATPALTLSTTITGILQGDGTALSAASTTGSGNVVLATSPTLITPALGTPSALVGTNITGTASGLTAGSVTTNANLTGPITSVGNATSIASQTGTGTKFVVDTSPTLVTPILGVATATGLGIGTTAPSTGLVVKQSSTADTGILLGNSSNTRKFSIDASAANAVSFAAITGTNGFFAVSNVATGGTGQQWFSYGINGPSVPPIYPMMFNCISADGGVTSLTNATNGVIPLNGNNVNGAPWVVMRNASSTANTFAGYVTAGSSGKPMSFAGSLNITQTNGAEVSSYVIYTQKTGTLTQAASFDTNGNFSAAGAISSGATQTTLTGSAGTAVCSQPFQGSSYKKVCIYLNAYTDTGTQTYTFPTAFTQTPYVYGLSGGVSGATASTTTVTFTTTLLSGFVFIEGY